MSAATAEQARGTADVARSLDRVKSLTAELSTASGQMREATALVVRASDEQRKGTDLVMQAVHSAGGVAHENRDATRALQQVAKDLASHAAEFEKLGDRWR